MIFILGENYLLALASPHTHARTHTHAHAYTHTHTHKRARRHACNINFLFCKFPFKIFHHERFLNQTITHPVHCLNMITFVTLKSSCIAFLRLYLYKKISPIEFAGKILQPYFGTFCILFIWLKLKEAKSSWVAPRTMPFLTNNQCMGLEN